MTMPSVSKIAQLLLAPEADETLKCVMQRGVPLYKWRIFVQVCAVDASHGKSAADLAREKRCSRAHISQVVKEVKTILSDDPFDISWKRYQRRAYVAVPYLDLKEGVSANVFWKNEFAPDYVCAYKDQRWKPFTQSIYRGGRFTQSIYRSGQWRDTPIRIDLSGFEVWRFGKRISTPQFVDIYDPSCNIVWCRSEGKDVPAEWSCSGYAHIGRHEILLFNCDGRFYELDTIDRDDRNRISCIWVKPVEMLSVSLKRNDAG